MTKSEKIKLPFIETIKRSFNYVLSDPKLLLCSISIGLVAFIYEVFSGFPLLCSLGVQNCNADTSQSVSNLIIVLVSVAIIINYCRGIILKTSCDFRSLSFVRRIALYILTAIGLYFAILLLGGTASAIISSVFYLFGYSAVSEIFGLIFLIMMMASAIILAPIYILFAAIAVDDRGLNLKEAFKITKGNNNKIFWGQIVMMLPCGSLMILLSVLSAYTGAESYMAKLLYCITLLLISFVDSCFKASFFAHIYQYFTFYHNKMQKKSASKSKKEQG